jgi:hypothetical protein
VNCASLELRKSASPGERGMERGTNMVKTRTARFPIAAEIVIKTALRSTATADAVAVQTILGDTRMGIRTTTANAVVVQDIHGDTRMGIRTIVSGAGAGMAATCADATTEVQKTATEEARIPSVNPAPGRMHSANPIKIILDSPLVARSLN